VGVAGQRDLGAEFLGVELLPLLEFEGIGGHEFRRRQAVDRGRGRYQQDVQFALQGRPQRRQAFGNEILVRREVS
jgi:hypothetical protein